MSQSEPQPQNRAAEFAQPATCKAAAAIVSGGGGSGSVVANDILLNNFQIRKKRYRVLLNCDHLVWERWDARRGGSESSSRNETAKSTKEAEYEREQLSQRAAYGSASHVVHIDELIKVDKCNSKAPEVRHSTAAACDGQLDMPNPPVAQHLIIHYAEHIVKSATDCNRWRTRTLTLFNSDPYIVRQWHRLLCKLLKHSSRWRVQRLLVFINPYGGRRQGLQLYERHCKPLFQLAGIDASCIISQRANQIRDILMSHDLTPFDAVCCVGGDGTVAEVINGLLFRSMRDSGIDGATAPEQIPKSKLPVGIIPAGSTDTVAYSLHGTADVATAAIHLVLGQRRGLDVCSVRNRQGLLRFCASVLSYGYLGDVAAKSEKYRWMGTKRYEYTGVKAFLQNRGYEAELRVLLPDDTAVQSVHGVESEQQQTSSSAGASDVTAANADTICYADCQRCSLAEPSQPALTLQGIRNHACDAVHDERADVAEVPPLPHSSETNTSPVTDHAASKLNSIFNETVVEDNMRNLNDADCDKNVKASAMRMKMERNSQQIKQLLDEGTLVGNARRVEAAQLEAGEESIASGAESDITRPRNWQVVRGHFFMISGANITCACSRSPSGISRYNHLGDGCLELILVRSTSLCNNLRLLVNTMGQNGDIRKLPFVEVHRTKCFSFRAPYSNGFEDENSIRGSCQPIVNSSSADLESDESVSRWNCDGEVVTDLDITMSSHCQLVDVFMRGPHAYIKPAKSDAGCCAFCSHCTSGE